MVCLGKSQRDSSLFEVKFQERSCCHPFMPNVAGSATPRISPVQETGQTTLRMGISKRQCNTGCRLLRVPDLDSLIGRRGTKVTGEAH